jgi:hypothetical protein
MDNKVFSGDTRVERIQPDDTLVLCTVQDMQFIFLFIIKNFVSEKLNVINFRILYFHKLLKHLYLLFCLLFYTDKELCLLL